MDTVTNSQKEPELKFYYKMLQYSGVVCSYLVCHTSFPDWEQTLGQFGASSLLSIQILVSFVSRYWMRNQGDWYCSRLPEVVNILVIDWLSRNYGYVNKPLPRASPSGIGSFTAIIPWLPVYNYNLSTSTGTTGIRGRSQTRCHVNNGIRVCRAHCKRCFCLQALDFQQISAQWHSGVSLELFTKCMYLA